MAKTPNAVLVEVTPEMAQAWLNRAKQVQDEMIKKGIKERQNRPLKENHVIKLALDMTEDRWLVNGETISIAKEGDPINGQHRLNACVLAGVPFKTFVVYDVDRTTFATFDSGKGRSGSDVFAIAGEKEPGLLATILTRVKQYEDGTLGQSSPSPVTNGQREELLEKYPDIRTYAKKAAKFTFQKAAVGTAYYLFGREYPTKTNEFMEQLRTGLAVSQDSPAYRLREKLNNRLKGTRLRQEVVLNYLFVALNAHINDKPLSRLYPAKLPLMVHGPKQKKAAAANANG